MRSWYPQGNKEKWANIHDRVRSRTTGYSNLPYRKETDMTKSGINMGKTKTTIIEVIISLKYVNENNSWTINELSY